MEPQRDTLKETTPHGRGELLTLFVWSENYSQERPRHLSGIDLLLFCLEHFVLVSFWIKDTEQKLVKIPIKWETFIIDKFYLCNIFFFDLRYYIRVIKDCIWLSSVLEFYLYQWLFTSCIIQDLFRSYLTTWYAIMYKFFVYTVTVIVMFSWNATFLCFILISFIF